MYLVLAPAHCTQCAPGDEEEALDYVDDDEHFSKIKMATIDLTVVMMVSPKFVSVRDGWWSRLLVCERRQREVLFQSGLNQEPEMHPPPP